MRVGGRALWGSGYRGAGSRLLAAASLTVLLLASGVTLVAPGAEAQTAPKWYGPNDVSRPSEGWAFRIPVTVINDGDSPVDNAVVTVELDLGKMLVESGWINESRGTRVQPRGFTLDPSSLRVVEYERGFRDFKDALARETPHLFYPALFESSARGLEFNATTNPVGTVLWVLKGATPANDRRYYYLYFNAREYGAVPAPKFTEVEQGPLSAYPYAGRGTTFYWYENGATGNPNRVDVYAPYEDTQVAIYEEVLLGQYRLVKLGGVGRTPTNPDELRNATNSAFMSYVVPPNDHYKLVSSKPVMVMNHGALPSDSSSYGTGAFAMAADGAYAGRDFRILDYTGGLTVYATDVSGTTAVSLVKMTGPDSDTVDSTFFTGTRQLTASSPSTIYSLDGVSVGTAVGAYRLTSNRPVVVQLTGDAFAPGRGQIHAIPAHSGALAGTAFSMEGANEDAVRIRAMDPTLLRITNPRDTSTQIYPLGGPTEGPGAISPGCDAEKRQKAGLELSVNATWNDRHVDVRTEKPDGSAGAFLTVETGGKAGTDVGFFGGFGGQRVLASGPASIVAHFNETRLTILECTSKGLVTRSAAIARDGRVTLQEAGIRSNGGSSEGRYEILSNKPISVFSTRVTDEYARFIPGRPVSPTYEVGAIEFRGHLVDLRSPERPGLIVPKTTGPNRPVEFKLTAYNLGQWIDQWRRLHLFRRNLHEALQATHSRDHQPWRRGGELGVGWQR